MAFVQRNGRDKAVSAAAVLLCHAAMAALLIIGLRLEPRIREPEALATFDLSSPPPPPPIEETLPRQATEDPEGAASPPNRKAEAAPVAAPEPVVQIDAPPVVPAAPVPRDGTDPSAGAAPVPGPGTGSGGAGTGTGSGGSGTGTGSGDGDGAGGAPVRRARLMAGSLSLADYPPALRRAGVGGRVEVHMMIDPVGRVSRCLVAQSSGSGELDAITCQLVQQRYRFDPARDARGRAVPDLVGESHVWTSRRRGR